VEIGVGVAATATGESRRGSRTPDAGERERARGGSLVLFLSRAGACLPCPTVQCLWALASYHYSFVPGMITAIGKIPEDMLFPSTRGPAHPSEGMHLRPHLSVSLRRSQGGVVTTARGARGVSGTGGRETVGGAVVLVHGKLKRMSWGRAVRVAKERRKRKATPRWTGRPRRRGSKQDFLPRARPARPPPAALSGSASGGPASGC
jgi:hypothetical protein